MPKYEVPANVGRVRVVMAIAGKYAVWNGKDRKEKFEILCRTRKQAEEVALKINRKEHDGFVEVYD